jgi:hypothetical protein
VKSREKPPRSKRSKDPPMPKHPQYPYLSWTFWPCCAIFCTTKELSTPFPSPRGRSLACRCYGAMPLVWGIYDGNH